MSARVGGEQLEVHVPLFGDADHRRRLGHAGDEPLGNRAAFIEHPLHPGLPLRQDGGEALCAVPAGDLFIVSERQPDRARRDKALGQECLDRLEDREDAGLIVESASTPDEPVGHDPGERRMGPAPLAAGVNRHDVEVTREQQARCG